MTETEELPHGLPDWGVGPSGIFGSCPGGPGGSITYVYYIYIYIYIHTYTHTHTLFGELKYLLKGVLWSYLDCLGCVVGFECGLGLGQGAGVRV